eukprot:21210-Heterocapsa_arctica.AAC.1
MECGCGLLVDPVLADQGPQAMEGSPWSLREEQHRVPPRDPWHRWRHSHARQDLQWVPALPLLL